MDVVANAEDHRAASPAIMPGSTRIVPPPHVPNMILPPRLDEDDNDDLGIKIRNTLLMWWRMKKTALLLLVLLPFRLYRFFLLLLLVVVIM